MTAAPLVALRGLCKHFGGVQAVDDVSLELAAGEVLAVVGHNGAGKSTLMKLVSGAELPDSGEIQIDAARVSIRSPRDARRLGIETLYQDLALADNLDAAGNVFLGRERLTAFGTLDERAMERAARAVIERLLPNFSAFREPVARLSGGQRQAVAIARAIQFEARILIMDEPTAALGPAETRLVADLIDRLKRDGLGIFLVSHDLDGVFELADRIAVLKNGRLVGIRSTAETTRDEILSLVILGRERDGA